MSGRILSNHNILGHSFSRMQWKLCHGLPRWCLRNLQWQKFHRDTTKPEQVHVPGASTADLGMWQRKWLCHCSHYYYLWKLSWHHCFSQPIISAGTIGGSVLQPMSGLHNNQPQHPWHSIHLHATVIICICCEKIVYYWVTYDTWWMGACDEAVHDNTHDMVAGCYFIRLQVRLPLVIDKISGHNTVPIITASGSSHQSVGSAAPPVLHDTVGGRYSVTNTTIFSNNSNIPNISTWQHASTFVAKQIYRTETVPQA